MALEICTTNLLALLPATSPSRAGRTLEESLPDRVFVKSGLKAGETVIVGGTHKVSDGTAVTCKEAK